MYSSEQKKSRRVLHFLSNYTAKDGKWCIYLKDTLFHSMMQMFTSCVKVATTCRSKLFKGTHLFSPIDSWNLLAISGLGTVRLYTVHHIYFINEVQLLCSYPNIDRTTFSLVCLEFVLYLWVGPHNSDTYAQKRRK